MSIRRALLDYLNASLRRLALFPQQRPRIVVLFAVVGLVFGLMGLGQLRLQLDMFQDLGPSFRSKEAQDLLDRQFGDSSSISVAFISSSDLKQAQVCQLKKGVEQLVNSEPDVARVLSPWSLRRPESTESRLWYKVLVEDPCLAEPDAPFAASLEKLRGSPWDGYFLGKNPNQILFEITFAETYKVETIGRLIAELKLIAEVAHPQLEMHALGQTGLRWYILELLRQDAIWNLGILVFFVIFFYFFIGTWRSGLYYASTLLFTEIMLFGTMGWLGFPIDTMANCLFLMTAIAGAADYLFVTSAQKDGSGWRKSFVSVATPSFFTSLTSFFGFLSLGVADIPMIERFGLAAAIGSVFQYFASFIFLPAMLSLFKIEKEWVRSHPNRQVNAPWFLKMNQFTPKPWMTLAMILVAIIGAFGVPHLNIGEDMLKNFPASHPFSRAHTWLKEDKDWQGQMFLIVNPKVPDTRARQILTAVSVLDQVKQIESASRIETYMTEGLSELRSDLVLREMSQIVGRRFKSAEGYTRYPIFTKSLDVKKLNLLLSEIEKICGADCRVGGRTVSYLESSSRISRSLIESLGASILAVIFILVSLTWLKGSLHALSFVVSSVWGPLMMLGFMWWTQWPVSSVTSIFFALIVGWTGDNAIQYMFAGDDLSEGLAERASATLMQTIIFCGSSLFLLFQVLIPMHILGMLFALGFFLTYVGDLWLLRGLIELGGRWKSWLSRRGI